SGFRVSTLRVAGGRVSEDRVVAGETASPRAGCLVPPAPPFPGDPRLALFFLDLPADLELGECELLDDLVLLVEGLRLHEHPGLEVRPELVTVTEVVPGLEHDRLAIVAGDPLGLALANGVPIGELARIGSHCRERPRVDLPINFEGHRLGEVALYLLVDADDFARRPVERFEALVHA